MCVVKLGVCPLRALIAAVVASHAATRQCEQIIKTYKILFFRFVALSHRSTHHSLYERTLEKATLAILVHELNVPANILMNRIH